MASFKCPQCQAEVKKDKDDPLGCPCCGYAKDMTVPFTVPYYYPVFPWWETPSYPWSPWITKPDTTIPLPWVGDPPPDQRPYIGDPIPSPFTTTTRVDINTTGTSTDTGVKPWVPEEGFGTGQTTWDPEQWKGCQVWYTN